MRELTKIIFFLVLVAAGYISYIGVKNAVQFHYNCGVDVPWYAAIFLDVSKCPSYGGEKVSGNSGP